MKQKEVIDCCQNLYVLFVLFIYCIILTVLLNDCRYLQPPSTWVAAQLESRELLSICLKKLKGINKVGHKIKLL